MCAVVYFSHLVVFISFFGLTLHFCLVIMPSKKRNHSSNDATRKKRFDCKSAVDEAAGSTHMVGDNEVRRVDSVSRHSTRRMHYVYNHCV